MFFCGEFPPLGKHKNASTSTKDFLIFNIYFIDIGFGLFGIFCKKFCILLLHDHSGCMIVLGPFQRQLKNNYLIFKPNFFLYNYSFSY